MESYAVHIYELARNFVTKLDHFDHRFGFEFNYDLISALVLFHVIAIASLYLTRLDLRSLDFYLAAIFMLYSSIVILVIFTLFDRWEQYYVKLVCILSAALIFSIKSDLVIYRKLPPGPWGIPFFGYLPFMKGEHHKKFFDLSKKYGDIFSVKMGQRLVVCIGSTKMLKKLFARPDSVGRPHTPLAQLLSGKGIIMSEGKLWKRQRTFLVDGLRNLGVKMWSAPRFEKFIIMEVEELEAKLNKLDGAPIDPSLVLGRYIHNVICQLTMSFRFKEDDESFKVFNENISRGMKLFGSIHYGEYLDLYVKLPGKQNVIKEIKENLGYVNQFHGEHLRRRMEEHANRKGYHEPADILDLYLNHLKKEMENKLDAPNGHNVSNSSDDSDTIFPGTDAESQIIQIMNDLFSAGMETSRTTILWCLIFMIRLPEVAMKVRNELRKNIHVGHTVTLEDRTALPYTEAVIFETIRMQSVVPLGTTHVNTNNWTFGDYFIPSGTHIIPLINVINTDPTVYPDPHLFKPERYMKDDKLHVDSFVQFGVGQRICLGLQLARMELFLFFANIMNKFDFHLPSGHETPSLSGVLGTTHAPNHFNLCFKKRDA